MGVAVYVVAGHWDGASILGVAGIPFVAGVLGLSVVAGKPAFVGDPVIGSLPVVLVVVGFPVVAVCIARPVHISGVPGGFLLGHLRHCPLKLT